MPTFPNKEPDGEIIFSALGQLDFSGEILRNLAELSRAQLLCCIIQFYLSMTPPTATIIMVIIWQAWQNSNTSLLALGLVE